MILYIRLLKESFAFAINALRNNKLRTLLSLLGVTVGIFSIIAVLAAVSSLEKNITDSFDGMDKNTIYLFDDCFGPSEIPDWKSEQFPNVTYEDYQFLKKNMNEIDKISYNFFTTPQTLKFEENTVNSIDVKISTEDFFEIEPFKVEKGRLFNEAESNSGTAVIVIGNEVAEGLFKNSEPIGKQIRLYGQRFTVIGVLSKMGENLFGASNDISVFVPVNAIRKLYGDNSNIFKPIILIKPKSNLDIDAFKAELTSSFRNFRSIKAGEVNNFFVNILSGFADKIDELIGQMNFFGWCISGFSLLVGGFGIANIMFVSVKERTNLIGIQKALGAKNRFILFQFLFEAVILAMFGGAIGILLVWIIALILTNVLEFEFILSTFNILLGSGLSILIGLISGILPAISASKLDPVEAIRTGM